MQSKIAHYDETMHMDHDAQIVRAKENSWATVSPADPLILYVRAVIESFAWPTVVQLKSYKPWLGLKLAYVYIP